MKLGHPSRTYGDCGPAALSILLGGTVTHWSVEILKYRRTHKPHGFAKRDVPKSTAWTFNSEIRAMVRRTFPKAYFKYLKSKVTARLWAQTADPKKTYLVSLMHHMCIYQNGYFYENIDFYKKPESFRCRYDIVEAVMELPNYKKYRPTKMDKFYSDSACYY